MKGNGFFGDLSPENRGTGSISGERYHYFAWAMCISARLACGSEHQNPKDRCPARVQHAHSETKLVNVWSLLTEQSYIYIYTHS